MKIIRDILIILLLMVFLPYGAMAGDNFKKTGTTAAQFLKIDAGARATAMGGAFSSIASDASALYWNPAGIALLDEPEVTFTYTNWIMDINHGFTGAVIPLGRGGSIGFSAVFQSMGEIEQTTIEQPRGTGLFFSAQDFAFGVTYARAMTDFIQVGITGKLIYQSIWNENATGVGIDIGMMLDTGIQGIKLAMVMSNFGTELKMEGRDLIVGYDQMPESTLNPDTEAKLSTESWPLPTIFRASVSTDFVGANGVFAVSNKNRVTAIFDVAHPNDNVEQFNFGAEYSFNERMFFRAGYKTQTDEEGLTFGAGFVAPISPTINMHLDYAYAEFGTFKYIQQFTFGLTF
ncbi:MAG: UPF0164 family protein [Calditrichaeota bacterium]|nr:UPF0164 family protein [Calditrichota bacterium]